MASVTSLFASPSVASSLPSFYNSTFMCSSLRRLFIVGPGHAPIPAKLAKKIIEAVRGVSISAHSKCRQVEIKDVLTWTKAFTIFQLILCASYPLCWFELTKYKLLIIQTGCQHPGLARLEYDLAFRRDATALGLNDWSKVNLDLYNFHLSLSTLFSLQMRLSSLPGFLQSSSSSPVSCIIMYTCHSAIPGMEGNAGAIWEVQVPPQLQQLRERA